MSSGERLRIDPAPPEVRSISPHKHDFPALDGLRGVAVLLVLLIHTAVPMTEGFPDDDVVQSFWSAIEPLYILGGTGVHLFFVLSGFLLFLPFARRLLVGGNKPRTGLFYKRRLLRILPAYYMALVLVWAVFERDTIVEPFKQFATHALLIHNYSWLTYRGLNVPTWTMAVESQFYLLLPLLGAAAVWLFSRSRMALGIGIGLLVLSGPLASVLARALVRLLPGFEQHEPILETLRFMSTFGMGLVAACIYVLAKDARVSAAVQQRLSRWGLVVFVVTFTVYVGRELVPGIKPLFLDYYTFALAMGVAYGGLLLSVVLRPASTTAQVLSRPTPRFLGDVSYSVYLLHNPIILGLLVPWAQHFSGVLALAVVGGGLLLVVLPVSVASFWFVERPFLQKKSDLPQAVSR